MKCLNQCNCICTTKFDAFTAHSFDSSDLEFVSIYVLDLLVPGLLLLFLCLSSILRILDKHFPEIFLCNLRYVLLAISRFTDQMLGQWKLLVAPYSTSPSLGRLPMHLKYLTYFLKLSALWGFDW